MLSSIPDEPLQARPRPATPIFRTVKQFSEWHPAFPESALRQLLFYSKDRKTSRRFVPSNGLAKAIVRLGRKVLIDEARFFEWLDSQQRGKA